MMADFWELGRCPSSSDLLHIAVMNGSNSGKHSLRTLVGIGFREHDFDFEDVMNLWTSSTKSSRNPSNVKVDGGSFVVAGETPVDRRIASIFSTKKSSKLCAVKLPLVADVTRRRHTIEPHDGGEAEKERQSLRGWPECSEIRANQ